MSRLTLQFSLQQSRSLTPIALISYSSSSSHHRYPFGHIDDSQHIMRSYSALAFIAIALHPLLSHGTPLPQSSAPPVPQPSALASSAITVFVFAGDDCQPDSQNQAITVDASEVGTCFGDGLGVSFAVLTIELETDSSCTLTAFSSTDCTKPGGGSESGTGGAGICLENDFESLNSFVVHC